MNIAKPAIEPVRYGLIGFGRFCRNRLIPTFSQITGSKIVALYKRDPELAKVTAKEFNIAAGYSRLEDLLANPEVEAVYITSAHADHEAQAIAAAQAGKHVLCEKPLATSVAACRNIIEACRENRVLLMVGQTLRFSPLIEQMKSWIVEGRLGRVCYAQAYFAYDGTKSPRTWLYDRRVAGGGALMDVGVHCLDTLRFLLGEIAEIRGILSPPREVDPVERSAQIALHFASGTLGSVFCSYEHPYRSRLEIMGELGRAWVEPFTLPWADVTVHVETSEDSQSLRINTGNPYGALIESFSRSIRGPGAVAIPGEEGLRNLALIEAVYSDRTNPEFNL